MEVFYHEKNHWGVPGSLLLSSLWLEGEGSPGDPDAGLQETSVGFTM